MAEYRRKKREQAQLLAQQQQLQHSTQQQEVDAQLQSQEARERSPGQPVPCIIEYQIGQLYMIARHSLEQSGDGEGVEIVTNEACKDPEYGEGQFTEKRIHLSSRLPYWIQAICPRVFYVTEKSWNFFPFTKTEYTCSFVPKLNVSIKTKYEDNNGNSENCLNLTAEIIKTRIVDSVDIAFDELPNNKQYKKAEDPKFFKSSKTNRGLLVEGWREMDKPIMCSYKLVAASFEVWGLQTKVEDFIHRSIRDVLLLGHRQAFTWIDEWHGMTLEDVRQYERKIQEETNKKLLQAISYPESDETTKPDNNFDNDDDEMEEKKYQSKVIENTD